MQVGIYFMPVGICFIQVGIYLMMGSLSSKKWSIFYKKC